MMRAARNNAGWSEAQHYRTAGDFRRNLAEVLSCLDEDEEAVIPWDDVRRVIQGWCFVRFRLRWDSLIDRGCRWDEIESELEGLH